VRGDITFNFSVAISYSGSPPRAWGHSGRLRPLRGDKRFTPTCVGTFQRPLRFPVQRRVHPHVRGDIEGERKSAYSDRGSPPRAWGHLFSRWTFFELNRFTPTCVGTLRLDKIVEFGSWVHPHVRGDIIFHLFDKRRRHGSPPRAWGHSGRPSLTGTPAWFTPTCVGTFRRVYIFWRQWEVHPHVRGDIRHRDTVGRRSPGSPPRAWGHSRHLHRAYSPSGFTPTCVGTF